MFFRRSARGDQGKDEVIERDALNVQPRKHNYYVRACKHQNSSNDCTAAPEERREEEIVAENERQSAKRRQNQPGRACREYRVDDHSREQPAEAASHVPASTL